jgi:hypothetical protein
LTIRFVVIAGKYRRGRAISPSLGNPQSQVSHPNQVIGRNRQGEVPGKLLGASVTGFPQCSDGFDSAEDLLNAFPDLPADLVPRMTVGAAINSGSPVCVVLSHMGRGTHAAQGGHESFRIVMQTNLIDRCGVFY